MKKIFKKLHLWLSIPLGILITIICLSGAILVFRTEIEEAANKELIFTKELMGDKLSISELIPIVAIQLENDTVTGVTIPSDPERNYSISVTSNRRAAVYINPYTGEVLGKIEGGFFSKVLQLHRWLLIKREIGKPIVGYTTLILVFILITGIIICFPKNRKQLKRIFSIKVTKGWRRFWYDLHVSGGTYVLIGLLVLSLTGLTWSFRWYQKPFYKLFGAEITQAGGHGIQQPNAQQQSSQQMNVERSPNNNESERPDRGGNEMQNREKSRESTGDKQTKEGRERSKNNNDAEPDRRGGDEVSTRNRSKENTGDRQTGDESRSRQQTRGQNQSGSQGEQQRPQETMDIVHWDNIVKHIQSENPNYKQISIRNNSATVTQKKTFGNSRASDRYSFDGKTGEIKEYLPYKDQERTTKVRGWIYSIHVGSWGGWFSKVITFLVALIGASLPVTGYYLWLKRLNAKNKNKKKVPV